VLEPSTLATFLLNTLLLQEEEVEVVQVVVAVRVDTEQAHYL
jgi:hypothetical protein